MNRYDIIIGKVPTSTEPEKEIVKGPSNPRLKHPGIYSDLRSPVPNVWELPLPIDETRRLNRYSFLHDPNIAAQIEPIAHMCFEAVSQASEENNRLLPRLGYHRFRPLVTNAAREFFLIGDVFLTWIGDDIKHPK